MQSLNLKTPPVLALLAAFVLAPTVAAIDYPGPPPGAARGRASARNATLENDLLAASWKFADGMLRPERFAPKEASIPLGLARGAECFRLVLGTSLGPRSVRLAASDLKLAAPPALQRLDPDPRTLRLGERFGGWELSARLTWNEPDLEVVWRAILRDGANYLRQEIEIRTRAQPVEVREITLLNLTAARAEVAGSVDGSPVVAGNAFAAIEHPMARNEVLSLGNGSDLIRCACPHAVLVEPGRPAVFSAVIGLVPAGQMRRGFLHYLSRERPQPHRTYFHDNCAALVGGRWFWQARLQGTPEDFARYIAQQDKLWSDRIGIFGRELVEKRGAVLDGFVHDHGWDEPDLVWKFHAGFPQGFANARAAAARFGAGLGVWISPDGGYNGRPLRLKAGQALGFETNKTTFALAGPRYYGHFRDVCAGLVRDQGVGYFKFDRFAAGNNQPGPGDLPDEVAALLRLCEELRQLKPDVYINPTVGTWPSPFWLRWVDALWRQQGDSGQLGKGTDRQQWITYRDNAVYHGTVRRGPLVPIADLMLHGIIIHQMSLTKPSTKIEPVSRAPVDVRAEIRSYFATGIGLQELHIDPTLMTDDAWNTLAEAAQWSRRHAAVLADSHWIGGDPSRGEVYGWAAWSPQHATLALRNPDDRPATFKVDLGAAFELPAGAPRRYVLTSPWRTDAARPTTTAVAGTPHEFHLQPFELAVWDCTPEAPAAGSR